MQPDSQAPANSKAMFWTGWVITALAAAGMIMSAIMKLMQAPQVIEGMPHLGWDVDLAFALGIVELTCALIYLFPQTTVLGAILLTGYLGGAIATHVRIHEQFVPPIILGVMIWGGIYLRDARLRTLLPLRS